MLGLQIESSLCTNLDFLPASERASFVENCSFGLGETCLNTSTCKSNPNLHTSSFVSLKLKKGLPPRFLIFEEYDFKINFSIFQSTGFVKLPYPDDQLDFLFSPEI